VKTYKQMWKESEKGAWAVGGTCPKCDGRAYTGGHCMDCGTYRPPSKGDKRHGVIEKLFDASEGGEL
jgi:hypothetical protein